MPGAIHRDEGDASSLPVSPPRRRQREAVPRARMMRFSLTEDEHAEVLAAASRAGRARAAFAAEATLAAARGTVLTPDTALDGALGNSDRLDYAAEQVRKVGVNLNQAVKVLNSTGQPPGDLPRLAEQAMRWAAQVDALSVDLWKRAISAIRPGGDRGTAPNPRSLTPAQPGGRTADSRSRAPGSGRPIRLFGAGAAVIGKICPRGDDVAGLIRYLYGPGRCEEHTDPHILAGYLDPDCLEPGLRPDGRRDFRRLVSRLRLPHDRQGSLACAKPVWHCSMRAAPEDRMLSDAEWAQIARDVMARTGLSPHGQNDQGVRWIAVRHGPDHIHLVAMLARQDGARVSTWNTRYRVRDACIAAEQRYGLRSTAPPDHTASPGPTRAETGKAERRALGEPPRVTLRRHVATAAATAASAEDFFAHLGQAGVQVRVRYSTKNPGQVTGYSVALPGDTTRDGTAVWYGGGKLAADLSWPKLTQRWAAGQQPVPHLTAGERQQLWEYAASVVGHAAAQIHAWSRTSPQTAADAAWAAGDTLRVTAAALGSRILRQATDGFDRAAREQYGRIPAPTPAGNRLRQAARLISAYGYLTHDKSFAPLTLIIQLAALAEAVAQLRQTQQRAHQAQAALRAATGLRQASRTARPAPPGTATAPGQQQRPYADPDTAQTAAQIAASSFPSGLGSQQKTQSPVPGQAARPVSRPSPGHRPGRTS